MGCLGVFGTLLSLSHWCSLITSGGLGNIRKQGDGSSRQLLSAVISVGQMAEKASEQAARCSGEDLLTTPVELVCLCPSVPPLTVARWHTRQGVVWGRGWLSSLSSLVDAE